MNRSLAFLTSGALLYAGAAWSANAGSDPTTWGRDLVRPMVLPFLWRSLADAERHGSIGEEIDKARLLMRLLPRWTDGHIVFAYRLGLQSDSAGRRSTRGSVARLDAAVTWMDEARADCDAEREKELFEAMAFLVELAAEHDADLDRALTERGTPAALWSDRILARAERVSDSAALRERRIFMGPRLMAHFLRLQDHHGASRILMQTLKRLDEVRDRELADRWKHSLMRLRSYLGGDRRVRRADLLEDPLLADLAPYLE